ncbi:cysteine hydrolase family protein [Hydrogenophaga sp. 5NK40-0174]|uniref:cysteine hydrolase family protein n=1 Tax=Hydrogenophaga sp. 5NK40-0174 TaxID=3127649 RepID=UPI0031053003
MTFALLIIDVQKAICIGADAAHDVESVIQRLNNVASVARQRQWPVVFIQHEEPEGAFAVESEGWQLDDRLAVTPGDIRVRKTACDAFLRTELQAVLKLNGVERLVIGGLQSEFCVDSTVRAALAGGYPVTLVADGHSTMDNGVMTASQIVAHHNRTLSNISSFGPSVTLAKAADI